ILFWFALSGGRLCLACEEIAALSADELMQRAVTHAETLDAAQANGGFAYRKVSVIEELDSSGKVKERKERIYKVSHRAGLTQTKLLQVNGNLPARSDIREQAENDTNVRHCFGTSKPARDPESFLTAELVARFAFSLVGKTNINERAAYEITFRPRSPEQPARSIVDRVLNRISGTLWLDMEEFEAARADIRLGSEVEFLWGVAGCLKKLVYTVTRTRVGNGVWLNSFSSGDFEGRKLLEPMRLKMRTQTSDFERH